MTEPLAEIEAMIRAIHHYGNPPDARLQGDVDDDVEEILAAVRQVVTPVSVIRSQREQK